jgi:hypothetical protein
MAYQRIFVISRKSTQLIVGILKRWISVWLVIIAYSIADALIAFIPGYRSILPKTMGSKIRNVGSERWEEQNGKQGLAGFQTRSVVDARENRCALPRKSSICSDRLCIVH